jgi:hypothetical protein
MPRPNKRTIASRRGGKNSALKRALMKRQEMESLTDLEATRSPLEISGASQMGIEADAPEPAAAADAPTDSGEFSEKEDNRYPATINIRQPKAGWEAAERATHGYSKTRVYRQKTSYQKNKEEIKKRREEKKALGIGHGIPVSQGSKPKWGDISAFFNSPGVSTSASPDISEPVPMY